MLTEDTTKRLVTLLVLLAAPLEAQTVRPAASREIEIPTFVPGERLSRSWRRYLDLPFVRDTLAPLVGPNPVVVQSNPAPPMGHRRLRALTLPYGYPASTKNPTEIRLYEERASDDLFAHEVGHVLDYRSAAPDVADSVRATFERERPRFYYAGQPTTDYSVGGEVAAEYVANAFARALQSGRSGFADSTQVEKRTPGAIHLIRWLQTRPPFGR